MKTSDKIGNGSYQPPEKILNYMFVSIFLANMALNMGQQMSNSLLSLYAKSIGTPADQIGQLMSMFAVTALIFRFVSGPAMNAFNRKLLLTFAMLCMTTAYLGFSFAEQISSLTGIQTIRILKGFRLVQGVGNAFGNSCCLTIASDTLPKDKFTSGMGYYACAQVVSQAVGSPVGILLRDTFGYHTTYIINAVVMLAAIAAASQVKLAPRESRPFSLSFDNIIAREALPPTLIVFMVNIGFTSINAFLLVYAEERGIEGASLFFTVYAVVLLLTRPLVGRLTDKYGFVKVGIPSLFMNVVSLTLIGFADSLPVLLLASVVNAFGYGAVQPMLQSLCMQSVPPERRGSAASTNFIGMDSATILGPIICGKAAALMGYTPIMWLAMTVPVLVGILCTFLFRKRIHIIEEGFGGKNI